MIPAGMQKRGQKRALEGGHLEEEKLLKRILRDTNGLALQASDKEIFYVDFSAARQSQLIQNVIEDRGTLIEDTGVTHQPILLPNVSSQILEKVIEYMGYHGMSNIPDDLMNQWDDDFVEVDSDTLFGLIWAADYLQMTNLLELACKCVSDVLNTNTRAEIRKTFNIRNDFTQEEREKISRQMEWFFQ